MSSSLYSSINSGISGLNAQSMAMANTASNISNIHSVGYKGSSTAFKTLVSSGANGVVSHKVASINNNGEFNYDSHNTDTNIAIDGPGLLTVNTKSDKTGKIYFTRNGSFNKDENGNFKNSDNVFLMAWKIGNENQDKAENLDVVNMSGIGQKSVPTTKVSLSMNLDASQTKASGGAVKANLTSSHNTNLGVEDIIYPDAKMQIGDKLIISSGNTNSNYTYGGFASSASVSTTIPLLGANNVDDNFSALKNGDKFILNTNTTGDVMFAYSSSFADTKSGTFNSLNSLADAINYKEGYSARVVDNNLFISPLNANEAMTFRNFNTDKIGLSKNINNVFGQNNPLTSVNSAVFSTLTPVLGAGTDVATFSGLVNNVDKLIIRLADGSEDTFTYVTTGPAAASFTFNSLNTLAAAINAAGHLDATIINANQMRINVKNTATDSAIVSISSTGNGNLSGSLGIKLDSTFKTGVTSGDKMEISVGAYDSVKAKPNIDSNAILTQIFKVTGKKLSESILGATASNVRFSGLVDGDTITIKSDFNANTSTTGHTFTFKNTPSTTPTSTEFNTMDTLVTAINNTTTATAPSGLRASVNNGALEILLNQTAGAKYIQSIATNSAGRDVASEIGIKFTAPTANDSFTVTLDNGASQTFVFKNIATLDQTKGEFNSLSTLQSTINSLLQGKVKADFVDSYFTLMKGNKLASNIYSVTGNVANKLGMNVSSSILKFNFTGNTSVPVALSGEFNDIFTLRDAINKFSNGSLNASIVNSGTTLSINGNNGGKIKYINDLDINGSSSFATKMGLKNADVVKSLGLNNTTSSTNQFSTLHGLSDLIDTAKGVHAETTNNSINIFTDNVLDTISFANHTDNKGDLVNLLNLPTSVSGPAYDSIDITKNMASGKMIPSFFSDISVFDSLGDAHALRLGFLKFSENSWGMEMYTNNQSEINNSRLDGLLSYGSVNFNSDGSIKDLSLKSVDGTEGNVFKANWTNGASTSDITLDFGKKLTQGEQGLNDGLRQFYGDYVVNQFDQDGSKVANVNNIYVDTDGYVNASFDNGTFRSMYRIPIATFVSPNNLSLESGNLYLPTNDSGNYALNKVGQGGAGNIVTKATEMSNVDLSNELQNLMSINQMYQSCLKILHTANMLIGELNKLIM